VTLWRIPAPESVQEWVGPLTVMVGATPTMDYQVAVVEYGSRPATWTDPVVHPDDTIPGLGVVVGAGSSYPLVAGKVYLIWVQIDLGTSEPVLDDVGIIIAT